MTYEIFCVKDGPFFEYICNDCKQHRLSFVADLTVCGNCGSLDITKGPCGTLKKESENEQV